MIAQLRPWSLPLLLALAARADTPVAVDLNEAGLAHLHAGRAEAAARSFEEALARLPEQPVLRRNLGAALAAVAEQRRRDRRPLDAIDLLDRAVRLHPERLRYRVLLGRVRVEGGRAVDRLAAREDFRHVLDRDPDHLDALVNLGQLEYLERRLEEAVDHWQHALRLGPSDPDVRARLAKAERELRVERAYACVKSASFRVRYAPAIPAETAATVLRLCEEAHGDLTKRFETYPEQIVVTLYPPEEFRSATQMHGWVSGLSDGTIRITVRRGAGIAALRATIYHELTHHLIRRLAPQAPVWLHEGLAQIAEEKSVARAEGRLRRLEPLASVELAAQIVRQSDPRAVSRFYDLALAFTHHLLELQGYPGFLRLCAALRAGRSEEQALRRVYGAGRDLLFRRWRERLLAR
ncbi:MAG: tetratricopeptide repeat protein [Planctomycetota bacterium]